MWSRNNPTAALPGLRPNRIGNPNVPRDQRTLLKYYDTGAFATVCAPGDQNCNPNTPGDAGRNIVRDLASSIWTPRSSRISVSRIGITFNCGWRRSTRSTRRTCNPDGSLASATAGQISSTIGNMRIANRRQVYLLIFAPRRFLSGREPPFSSKCMSGLCQESESIFCFSYARRRFARVPEQKHIARTM